MKVEFVYGEQLATVVPGSNARAAACTTRFHSAAVLAEEGEVATRDSRAEIQPSSSHVETALRTWEMHS